ncbi:MAG: retron St85 family effector protein [Devosia sp.]
MKRFYDDLDKNQLRVTHPFPLIFLCGGKVGLTGAAQSLRDYIYRTNRPGSSNFRFVLAEQANALYRDTRYHDLISFEEDIARIASLVVVIAESPGSLAELGAFASSPPIRPSLRILIQELYASDESFIRFGPVERIRRDGDENVGVFPWTTKDNGFLDAESVAPHAEEIEKFLGDHMKRVPASTLYVNLPEAQVFFLIYWIIYLGLALSHSAIASCLLTIMPTFPVHELSNKIYCMEIAGWVKRLKYSGKEYLYACDGDPFAYSFKAGVTKRDSLRRKTEAVRSIKQDWQAPKYVRDTAASARGFQR